MDDVIPRGAKDDVVSRRAHQGGALPATGDCRPKLKSPNVTPGALRPGHPALVRPRTARGSDGRHQGRTARDEGERLGRPAVVGQRGVKDVRELHARAGHDIRGARAETLDPRVPSTPKRLWRLARTVPLLKNSGVLGAVLPATSVRARLTVPLFHPRPGVAGIAGEGTVGDGQDPAEVPHPPARVPRPYCQRGYCW